MDKDINIKNTPRVLAFYLPQFHPIPENDLWWGKGFTEWTNVGKARPLFKGHYQPKVPADLGYYDLRLSDSRIAQAEMAKAYGIEGFCYWHYWFGDGKRLLERPFNEVLSSGKPDFPFCLCWANHSWEDKLFNKGGSKKLLIEQQYPGEEDYRNHFNTLLPAFKDPRYVKVDGKVLFMIYAPFDMPDVSGFINLWQNLAREAGLKGVHFVAHTYNIADIETLKEKGFDGVNLVRLFHYMKYGYPFHRKVQLKLKKYLLGLGQVTTYKYASRFFTGEEDKLEYCYPTIIPNWDHSPRSGRKGHIIVDAEPYLFEKHVRQVLSAVRGKSEQHQLIFLKSWNEWAEGNYMEPDLKYGTGYLEALKSALNG